MPSNQAMQMTVVSWATATFGPPCDDLQVAARVQKELLELSEVAQHDVPGEALGQVAADAAIGLYLLADRLGANLDRRAEAALMMGMAAQLVAKEESLARAALRAETKLLVARNMLADKFPRTRALQEITAVRVILEEVARRLGRSLTDEVNAQMARDRSVKRRIAEDGGSGAGHQAGSTHPEEQ